MHRWLISQVKCLLQIIVKFRVEFFFLHVSTIRQYSFCTKKVVWQYSKRERIENLYFPEGK